MQMRAGVYSLNRGSLNRVSSVTFKYFKSIVFIFFQQMGEQHSSLSNYRNPQSIAPPVSIYNKSLYFTTHYIYYLFYLIVLLLFVYYIILFYSFF